MEKEVSNGSMLGIVLIALACIIGLGFGIFSIAKNTANEGVTGVQENLNAVGESAYTDFDQKIVTGTQVMSAYNNFNGKNVAILIATQATKNKDNADEDYTEGAGVPESYEDSNGGLPIVRAYSDKEFTTEFTMKNSDNENVTNSVFINYNALLYGAAGKTASGMTESREYGKMYFDTNCFRTTEGYATDAGKVQFNNVSGNMTKSGMMEYIPSGARFQAYLVKDTSGTTLGAAFEQIGSK